MRLVHVSTVMAALALVGATALYLKVEQLERDLGSRRAAPREGAKMDAVAVDETRGGSYGRSAEATEARSSRDGESVAGGGTGSGAGRIGPASVEERLARLERDQQALRGRTMAPWRSAQSFARNMDDLAGQLSLTATQRTRIEDVIARGKQRIEDVLKIPDETGKSPYERRAEARKKIEEAMKNPEPGGVLAFATDLMSHRDKKIPGRNDTYAGEINRIRKETREEMASALDAKQQETFANTNVDGLLGESGQVSFAYAVGDTGADGQHEFVVEMGSEIVTDEAPAAPEAEESPPETPASGGR